MARRHSKQDPYGDMHRAEKAPDFTATIARKQR